jgi:hypothetical protein
MTSLTSYIKQIPLNNGYYINVGDCRTTFYQNNGTDEAPLISSNTLATSTLMNITSNLQTPGNTIFRDHGKTLLSSGRVFRKVQLMVSTNQVRVGGTDGVGGFVNATETTPSYFTGYVELPGTGGYSSGSGSYTPIARLG